MVFYYYLQFKLGKVFFNTLEWLFMLYTSCKTLHSVIAFSLIQRQITYELQYKSPKQHKIA